MKKAIGLLLILLISVFITGFKTEAKVFEDDVGIIEKVIPQPDQITVTDFNAFELKIVPEVVCSIDLQTMEVQYYLIIENKNIPTVISKKLENYNDIYLYSYLLKTNEDIMLISKYETWFNPLCSNIDLLIQYRHKQDGFNNRRGIIRLYY